MAFLSIFGNSKSAAPKCKACAAKGLAIMPFRYALAPKKLGVQLPGWAASKKSAMPALGDEFVHALRVMRAGFLYLYYGDGPLANQWQCYRVNADGLFWLQGSPAMASADNDLVFHCKTPGHKSGRLEHIVVEQAESVSKLWMAFSEHKWSPDTLKNFADNANLRGQRMQFISPRGWVTHSGVDGLQCPMETAPVAVATVGALQESVIEYKRLDRLSPSQVGLNGIFNKTKGKKPEDYIWQYPDGVAEHELYEKKETEIDIALAKSQKEQKKAEDEDALKPWMVIGGAATLPFWIGQKVGGWIYDWIDQVNRESNLKDARKMRQQLLTYDRVSNPANGALNKTVLERVSTDYPWALRNTLSHARESYLCMKERMAGMSAEPMLIALVDPVGLACELNGALNLVSGQWAKYQQEMQKEFDAINLLETLEGRLNDHYLMLIADSHWYKPADVKLNESRHLKRVAAHPVMDSLEKEWATRRTTYFTLLHQWGARRLPRDYADELDHFWRLVRDGSMPPGVYDQNLAQLKARVDADTENYLGTFDGKATHLAKARAEAQFREVYKGVDHAFRKTLKHNQEAAGKEVETLLEKRFGALRAALTSPCLTTALKDYAQGEYELQIMLGNCLHGINGCKGGRDLLAQWLKEAEKEFSEGNLLAAGFTFADKAAREDLRLFMKQLITEEQKAEKELGKDYVAFASTMKNYLKPLSSTTLNALKNYAKRNQEFAAALNGVAKTNASAMQTKLPANTTNRGASASRFAVARQILNDEKNYRHSAKGNKFVFTCMDWLSGRTARPQMMALSHGEIATRHFMAVSSGLMLPENSANMLRDMAKSNADKMPQWAQRLQNINTKSGGNNRARMLEFTKILDEVSEENQKIWQGREKVFSRFATGLSIYFEMVNLQKLAMDAYKKNNPESWVKLSASAMALVAQTCEWRALRFDDKTAAGYIRFKVWGGRLACIASAIGAGFDFANMRKDLGSGRYGNAALNFAKFAGGVTQSLAALGNAFIAVNSKKVISKRLAVKVVEVGARKVATSLAVEYFAISAGSWLSLFILGIQFVQWCIEPTALEKWCQLCGVGKDRDEGDFIDAEMQAIELDKVIGFS